MTPWLFWSNGRRDSFTIEGARVIDPVEGVDAALDVTVEQGMIARLEPGARRVQCRGEREVRTDGARRVHFGSAAVSGFGQEVLE